MPTSRKLSDTFLNQFINDLHSFTDDEINQIAAYISTMRGPKQRKKIEAVLIALAKRVVV